MKPFNFSRVWIYAGCLLVALAVLEARLINLQVVRHSELFRKAQIYRFTRRLELSGRGQIRDRNGVPLVVTLPVKDLYAGLVVWTNHVDLLAPIVAPLLGADETAISRYIQQKLVLSGGASGPAGPGAVPLKRGVTPEDWAVIQSALNAEDFGLPTNHLSSAQRAELAGYRRWALTPVDNQVRLYLQAQSLAQVLGYAGPGAIGGSLRGAWGLEREFDNILAGTNGECVSSQDAGGTELAYCRTKFRPMVEGSDVVLTIDLTLQQIVEQALVKVMLNAQPRSVSCVVVNPNTGEILAMAMLPSYSPQNPCLSPADTWRNLAVSDRHEVGSAFKVVTLASALELGCVNLDQQIFCEGGSWVYKNSVLRDDVHHFQWLSVRECLAKSSNIGLAKIALLMGPGRFYDMIDRFGCCQPTGVPLPDETAGFIRKPKNWTPTSITRVAIGQEFAISQMQLTMAYCAIANGGRLMRPMLVREVDRPDGTVWKKYTPVMVREVVSAETARLMRSALQYTVEHGTGTAAIMPDYTAGGKTGTAQVSNSHGYIPGQLYCSFIGMVPAENPALVIAVAVDQPKDATYGGVVAAPVFREIADQAMRLYHVAPDKAVGRPILAMPAPK